MAVIDEFPYLEDITIALRDCLCALLDTAPYTPVCSCCVQHNAGLPPMDRCGAGDCGVCTGGTPPRAGNGQAWVRVVEFHPSALGASTGTRPRPCDIIEMAVTIELGIYRCITAKLDGNVIPGCAEHLVDAVLLMQDANALWRAATCCTDITKYNPKFVQYQPVAPQGGCAGGFVQIQLTVGV